MADPGDRPTRIPRLRPQLEDHRSLPVPAAQRDAASWIRSQPQPSQRSQPPRNPGRSTLRLDHRHVIRHYADERTRVGSAILYLCCVLHGIPWQRLSFASRQRSLVSVARAARSRGSGSVSWRTGLRRSAGALAIAWSQVFVSSPWGRHSLAPQHRRWMAFGIFCVLVGLWLPTSKRMPTA